MLAKVCEQGIVASLYDCKLRISLWSAIALTGSQVFGDPDKISAIPSDYQQWHHGEAVDYVDSKYRQKPEYYQGLAHSTVDRGHLVPRYYAGLDDDKVTRARRVNATYTYFNLVPQYKELNGIRWRRCENMLIK